jgi:FkbM family methyltransferase
MRARLRFHVERILRRLGWRVALVGGGAALVARQPGPELRNLGRGTVLVTRPELARTHWLEHARALEAHLLAAHIAGVLDLYGVTCVLDVGANRGQYGLMLRRAGYEGHIVSFEPVRDTFEELRRTAAPDPRWSVHRCALGREDGAISMRVVEGTMSSVLPATRFGAGRYAQLREAVAEEVPLRRLDGMLDAVLAHVPVPRPYLKLDTQGYDLEAFAGLGARASEVVALQSELSLLAVYRGMPTIHEALGTYTAAGFEVSGLFPVSRQRRTARAVEVDCVMVRADAVQAGAHG